MRNRQTFGIRLQVVRQTRGPNLYDLHCRHATFPTYKMASRTPNRRISSIFIKIWFILRLATMSPCKGDTPIFVDNKG